MPDWPTELESAPRSSVRQRHAATPRADSPTLLTSLSENLLLLTDGLFCLTLLVTLLVFAGRTPTGQLCLLIGTVLTVSCWILAYLIRPAHQWKWTGLEPFLLLGIGLAALQLTPWDEETLRWLSPTAVHLAGAESDRTLPDELSQGLGWNRISLAPHATRLSLASVICVSLLFLIQVQRFQNRVHARRLILGLSLGVALFGLFGIIQLLTSNRLFFWTIEHPYTHTSSAAKGSFTNPNHFAGFLALAIGPLLAWTLGRSTAVVPTKRSEDFWNTARVASAVNWKLLPGGILLTILLTGIVLSLSRGGLILGAVALGTTMVALMGYRLTDSRGPLFLVMLAFAGLGGISLIGEEYLNRNAHELVSGDIEKLDNNEGRRFVWQANWEAIQAFPWLGAGLGAHADVLPAFHSAHIGNRIYTHAENSYLQMATEQGLTALGLLAGVVLLVVCRLFLTLSGDQRDPADAWMRAGLFGSLAVFLVHGTYDFPWYAPAYMVLAATFFAYLFASSEVTRERFRPPISIAPLLMLAGLLWGVGQLGPSVQRAAFADNHERQYLILTVNDRTFDTVEEELLWLKLRIQHISAALQQDPENGRLHLGLSDGLRRLFELNMLHGEQLMPVTQIREAVYMGGFQDISTMREWLLNPGVMERPYPMVEAALVSAQKALQHNPCLSSAWLTKSDLCFIHSPDPTLPDYFLERARRVSGQSAEISFTQGFHAWCRGDVEETLAAWKPIFGEQGPIQRRIIELITSSFSPAELFTHLQPDLPGQLRILRAYDPAETPGYSEAAQIVAREALKHAETLPNPREQRAILLQVFNAISLDEENTNTQAFINLVTERYPQAIALRKAFGVWFVKQNLHAEALPHLQVVQKQVPHDPHVAKLVQDCQAFQSPHRTKQAATPSGKKHYR